MQREWINLKYRLRARRALMLSTIWPEGRYCQNTLFRDSALLVLNRTSLGVERFKMNSVINSSFVCSFIHAFIHAFLHSFIHLSIHPFIHPFIHSFIHPSIHPFVAERLEPRTSIPEVPGSNPGPAVAPLGKALYPHCLVFRRRL